MGSSGVVHFVGKLVCLSRCSPILKRQQQGVMDGNLVFGVEILTTLAFGFPFFLLKAMDERRLDLRRTAHEETGRTGLCAGITLQPVVAVLEKQKFGCWYDTVVGINEIFSLQFCSRPPLFCDK
jgi:hypothetical protein